MDHRSSLRDDVIAFVRDHTGHKRKEIGDETTLLYDLGVDGDDAIELLEAFIKKFGIDPTGLDVKRHFNGEFGFFRSLYKAIFTDDEFEPLTIGMLVKIAAAKRWALPAAK
jgi:acyl carrier protein